MKRGRRIESRHNDEVVCDWGTVSRELSTSTKRRRTPQWPTPTSNDFGSWHFWEHHQTLTTSHHAFPSCTYTTQTRPFCPPCRPRASSSRIDRCGKVRMPIRPFSLRLRHHLPIIQPPPIAYSFYLLALLTISSTRTTHRPVRKQHLEPVEIPPDPTN